MTSVCKRIAAPWLQFRLRLALFGALTATVLGSGSACAASDAAIEGAKLSLFWVLPFAGILGSLAFLPIIAPQFWHRNYGLVALFWGLAFLVPFAAIFGAGAAFHELVHVLVLEYIPFIALIGSLFTIAGGIYVGGELRGSPKLNSMLMLAGMILASFAGTTGAAMILIRPIIRANEDRHYKTHIVVFFIFLVCNIGGAHLFLCEGSRCNRPPGNGCGPVRARARECAAARACRCRGRN